MGALEVLILFLVRFGLVALALYFVVRYFLWPVFKRYWKPKQMVLDAKQKRRIAEASLEATELEIQAAIAEQKASAKLDDLLYRTENANDPLERDFQRRLEKSSPSPISTSTINPTSSTHRQKGS